ncbi:copper homeostasis protein CutC [Nocardioides nanhaiensis]|uniref:Copper homeostasis protein cutC homolog n=1 Tax=Nocardioides nanhaiensis TaxID=1476871 RepID=A0ABP8VXU6_9ACTN
MGEALLEVTVLHARDVPGCREGGADRLLHVVPDDEQPTAVGLLGTSPEPAAVSAVVRASDLPVRVVLRTGSGLGATGGEMTRLVALAEEYVALGAEGVAFGFLTGDLEVDVETCRAVAAALPGVPWTFHRALDLALEPARSWQRLTAPPGLPGLTAVCTGGSPQGLEHGLDQLLAQLAADPAAAPLAMAGGGLLAEHVPWLARAGVRQFQVDLQVRPGATLRSYVDADFVRSWRRVLDTAPGVHPRARPA